MKCYGSLWVARRQDNEGAEKSVRFTLWPPYSKSIARRERADIEKERQRFIEPMKNQASSMDMQEDLPSASSGGMARSQCASWLLFVELNKKVTDHLRERSSKLVRRASTPMDCVCCAPPKRD